jgi:nucleoside-diphosphate-sugar epimerase
MRNSLKRVLVTGGAGFLGSHLCERLITQGHDVLCVDNYFTGRKENVDLTGSSSRIIYGPLPIDDPIQRCPDISQASAILDWKPRTDLRSGLERTIAYFEELLSGIHEPPGEEVAVAD